MCEYCRTKNRKPIKHYIFGGNSNSNTKITLNRKEKCIKIEIVTDKSFQTNAFGYFPEVRTFRHVECFSIDCCPMCGEELCSK